jgi:hypothetical protein
MVTAGARFSADFGESSRLYLEGSFDGRQYVDPVDDFGFDGIRWERAPSWAGSEISARRSTPSLWRRHSAEFRGSRFSDVVAPDYGGQLRWTPQPGTVVRAQAGRTLEETTLPGVSSYLRTTASLNVSQLVRDDLRLYGGASAAMLDFQDAGREDQIVSAWLGVRKYVAPRVFIGAEAAYQERESNEPTNDFTENRIMVRAGVESGPAYDEAALAAAPAFAMPSVYLGLRGGVSSLVSMLDGPRQHGQDGSLTADFGDLGWTGTLLAASVPSSAAGISVSRLMAGSARRTGITVGCQAAGCSRSSRRENYGVSGLLGRVLTGGNLVYGTAGPRWAKFKTITRHRDRPSEMSGPNSASSMVSERAPRHRSASPYRWSTSTRRMMILPSEPDSAGPTVSPIPKAGPCWGSATTSTLPGRNRAAPPMRDYGGFYWGLQAGHGMLASFTTGDRQEEGDPPTAERAERRLRRHRLHDWRACGLELSVRPLRPRRRA